MKFQKYLNEGVNNAMVNTLLKCTDILREYRAKYKVFFRGYATPKNAEHFMTKMGRVESGRIPMSTSPIVHEYMNMEFYKKFGWPARNGVFVNANVRETYTYGRPYVFFPTNGFKYVWSAHVIDFYNSLPDPFSGAHPMYVADGSLNDKGKEIIKYMIRGYSDFGLHLALSRENEVMFNVKKYYILSVRHPDFPDIMRELSLFPVAQAVYRTEYDEVSWKV